MVLGSTQPVAEMSASNISWGNKGGRCVRLTTLLPSFAHCLEIWTPQPSATLKACPSLNSDCFTFYTAGITSQKTPTFVVTAMITPSAISVTKIFRERTLNLLQTVYEYSTFVCVCVLCVCV
jgi:hypothetical protein